jgi:serine/threonine protein kinase
MCDKFFDRHIKKIAKIKTDWSIDDFTNLKVLGKGKFGSVDLYIENKTGIEYAIKTIHISENNIIDIDTRILKEILNQIIVSGHPNICSIIGTFRINCDLYIVQDMCGSDMNKMDFKTISVETKVKWMINLLSAVEHCHKLGILHLDIKLANCLITKDNVLKLSDFGFSQNVDSIKQMVVGTPNYLAPEIAIAIYDNTQEPFLSKAADIWACGVLFVFMFQKKIFTIKKNSTRLMGISTEIVSHRVTAKDIEDVPDLYKPVTLEMLEHSYKMRIKASKALDIFKTLND